MNLNLPYLTHMGIISIDIADPKPERIIAAEHLKCIKKIVETVRGDIVIGKRHKGDLAFIHPIREVSPKVLLFKTRMLL